MLGHLVHGKKCCCLKQSGGGGGGGDCGCDVVVIVFVVVVWSVVECSEVKWSENGCSQSFNQLVERI